MSPSYIILLDPSLIDHNNTPSTNLGDIIIYDSVLRNLNEIFPEYEIIRISTHDYLEIKHINLIKKSAFTIIGGTNLLSSKIGAYNQWKTYDATLKYLFPNIKSIILFGVGWWQYQQKPDLISKQFYKKVLNKEIIHSVRDSYTEEKLNSIGINNTLNTSCPTLWALDGVNANHNNLKTKNCLFTLTDYSINVSTDTTLIESILSGFSGEIKFFPQGFEDIQYLNSLEVYKQNKVRIQILERNINEFYNHLSSDFCYIGTRLHAGIKCIEKGLESLIIAVDNRAKEMSKDVSLPVVDRLKIQTVNDWIEGKLIFKNISLPTESIIKWKNQFK